MKKVKDIMAENAVTADSDISVANAARLMLAEDVGCLWQWRRAG